MNENIDLTKILKDCPKWWKLYSPVFGEVEFVEIDEYDKDYPIIVQKLDKFYRFTIHGELYLEYGGECILFPSLKQRDWSKFKAKKPEPKFKVGDKLVQDKFDPKTFQVFDKVLVRDYVDCKWMVDFYSYKEVGSGFPYRCVGSIHKYCIPYNDDTKHLVGTEDEPSDYYRYWED